MKAWTCSKMLQNSTRHFGIQAYAKLHLDEPVVSYLILYEIFMDKIFVNVEKTTKSTKILVPKSFRLYGSYVLMMLD